MANALETYKSPYKENECSPVRGRRSNKIKQIYKGKAAMRRVTAFSVLWLL